MKKRILSLLTVLVLLAVAVIPVAMAVDEEEDNTPSSSAGYYYVYTENGKGLNVRATPGGQKVGSLKYGTRIYCYYRDNGFGWALIDYDYDMPGVGYGTYACFISSRYLRKNKPPAKPSESGSTKPAATGTNDPLTDMNAEFLSAKTVDNFIVYTRPTRASGWVNLRWAPSKDAEIMANYGANTELVVLKETTNWYQVENTKTGDVGFVMKEFIVQ